MEKLRTMSLLRNGVRVIPTENKNLYEGLLQPNVDTLKTMNITCRQLWKLVTLLTFIVNNKFSIIFY